MGESYDFDCTQCKRTWHVSGGTDAGMLVTVTTIVCLDCKELRDVVIVEHKTWVTYPPVCPIEKTHRIEAWTFPGHCPRCGSSMEYGEMMRLWD